MKSRRAAALGIGCLLLGAAFALLWFGSSEPTGPQAAQQTPGSAVSSPEQAPEHETRSPPAQVQESRQQPAGEGAAQEEAGPISPAELHRAVAAADKCMEEFSAACERDPLDPGIGAYTARCKPLVRVFKDADYADLDGDSGWTKVGWAMFKSSVAVFRWNKQVNACLKLQKQAKAKR